MISLFNSEFDCCYDSDVISNPMHWRSSDCESHLTAATLERKVNSATHECFKSSKRSSVNPFHAMEIVDKAIQIEHTGEKVIHMEVGQTSASALKPVLENAKTLISMEGSLIPKPKSAYPCRSESRNIIFQTPDSVER